MVKVSTYFAMTFGAFLFLQSMEKVNVWIALHQDEKALYWMCDTCVQCFSTCHMKDVNQKVEKNNEALTRFGDMQERLEKEMEIKRLRAELVAKAKENESHV